jgi:outer membrane lipoprotein carrier protein
MKKLLLIGLASLSFSFSACSVAQPAADDLAKILSNLQSMRAHFSQQVLDGKGHTMQQSSGTFALKRPGKFRWETEQPVKQLLIADGTKIWVYDKELQQVTIQAQDNQGGNSPAMLLSGSIPALKKNFQVSFLQKPAATGSWFLLRPKNKDAMFQSVELNFIDDKLQGMRLIDNLGQASVLQFSNVINNPVLPLNLFQFKAPKGVDVIDQTVED